MDCTVANCGYQTPDVDADVAQALALLQMHRADVHAAQAAGGDQNPRISKIWEPEKLSLEPTESNEAAYKFWKSKFEDYLQEAGIDREETKFSRLKAKLDLGVYEHMASVTTYRAAMEKLDSRFITPGT